jgi:hypothetical protein
MEKKPLSIAVLYTGQIRTLLQTIEAFKRNVIEPNKHHNIHIYTCLEYPESPNQIEINEYKKEVEEIFHDQFQTHIISMIWISSKDPLCRFVREKTVENMQVSDLWKDYLCNRSGSITEYYQLYKGYEQIEEYSKKHQVTYDLFIRTRCDIMIPNPLDFDILQYSEEEFIKRFQIFQHTFPTLSNAHLIAIYLTTIIQPIQYALKRVSTKNFTLESLYNKNSELSSICERFLNPNQSDPQEKCSFSFLKKILDLTRITYRQNLFYFGFLPIIEKEIIFNYKNIEEKRRKYSYSYNEKERTIEGEKMYWFNAENIYQKNMIEKEYIIINSYTENEENSLYKNYKSEKETEIFYLLR